jgi:pilus assembly protein CpaB
MRAKSLLLLLLALGCGLVASIGITQVMAKRTGGPQTPATNMATIFVALENVPTGDPITPQVIKLEPWPKDKVPPGALTKLEDIENRRPKTTIYKGAPILENQLLPRGSNQGATSQIPKGYRVVAVKVDDVSGSSSLIRPGDRVDVICHFQKNSSKGIEVTKTQTVLEDIKVFAVNDVYDLDSSSKEKKIAAKTINLLVTPAQAEKVTLISELGKVRLVMRSYEDEGQFNSPGTTTQDVLTDFEKSDRQKDDPAPPSQPIVAAAKPDEFLKFLESKKTEAAPAAVAEGPREPNNWTIRVITANQVNDVVMQLDGAPNGSSAQAAGTGRWTNTTPRANTSAAPATATAPAPSTEAAAPAQDPSAAKDKTPPPDAQQDEK